MTAKEKAKELVRKFIKHSRAEDNLKPINSAKECALICVDEIIKSKPTKHIPFQTGYQVQIDVDYWNEVKLEIEKL